MREATSHRMCRASCRKRSKIKVFMKMKKRNNDLGGLTLLQIVIITTVLIVLGLLFFFNPKKETSNDFLLNEALCFVKQKNFLEAERSYKKLLKRNPHHLRALRGMGTIHMINNEPKLAIKCYRKAYLLGDVSSLRMLAGTYVRMKEIDKIEGLIPQLMIHRTEDQEFLNYIIIYALHIENKELFVKALKNVPVKYIHEEKGTAQLVEFGIQDFKLKREL